MSRRQFFATLFSYLVTAPLIRLGWRKAPTPLYNGLFNPKANIARQYREGAMDEGISIRLIQQYVPLGDHFATRMDVTFGYGKVVRSEVVCIQG